MKKLALVLPLLVLCGCAYMSSHTKSYNDKGQITGTTDMRGYALFDSKNSLLKLSNQSAMSGPTNSPFSPGTRLGGLNQEATTSGVTNFAPLIESVVSGAVSGAIKAAK